MQKYKLACCRLLQDCVSMHIYVKQIYTNTCLCSSIQILLVKYLRSTCPEDPCRSPPTRVHTAQICIDLQQQVSVQHRSIQVHSSDISSQFCEVWTFRNLCSCISAQKCMNQQPNQQLRLCAGLLAVMAIASSISNCSWPRACHRALLLRVI